MIWYVNEKSFGCVEHDSCFTNGNITGYSQCSQAIKMKNKHEVSDIIQKNKMNWRRWVKKSGHTEIWSMIIRLVN